jgi:hypothetical protein
MRFHCHLWCVRVWTGFNWPRIGTSGALLWTLQWTFRFHKMRGTSSSAQWLSASQGGRTAPWSSWLYDKNHVWNGGGELIRQRPNPVLVVPPISAYLWCYSCSVFGKSWVQISDYLYECNCSIWLWIPKRQSYLSNIYFNILLSLFTQPPIQWVPRVLPLGIKRLVREADHSPPSSAENKECVELYLHSPIRLHGVVLS